MTNKASSAELGRRIGERIGYEFSNTDNLLRALTHSSAGKGNYERLEFLGDRVLGLVIAQLLFAEFPEADEGELSRRLNFLVNGETCSEVAEEIGLGEFIATGQEIRSLKGRKRLNLRADAAESLIAAIYLDGGLEPSMAFIERYWGPRVHVSGADRRDAKTELQEWAHKKTGQTPVYTVKGRSGPDHDPVFTVRVEIFGVAPEQGKGRSKREAEQAAASAVLLREQVWLEDKTSK